MSAQITEPKYKKCVTYPKDCLNCSEGQRAFCNVPALTMKIGNQTYRRVKGHYEYDKYGCGKASWVEWELVK
jgi:hypothetical protein